MNLTPEHTKMPSNLSKEGKTAYKSIMKVMEDTFNIDTGGCTTFYSPKQWVDRKEEYGTKSELIICHDGGTVGEFFSYDNGAYGLIAMMSDSLEEVGLYAEQCTSWYTAIYKI